MDLLRNGVFRHNGLLLFHLLCSANDQAVLGELEGSILQDAERRDGWLELLLLVIVCLLACQ